MTDDFLLNALGMFVAAGVSYGAIKNDLKNIHEKVQDLKQSNDIAHKRIDTILYNRRSTDHEE